jgi:hypothetical protein
LRSLNFCHAIRQNLSHDAFFGVNRARIETILDRVSKRDDAERENRDAQENLVEGKGAMKLSNFAYVSGPHNL